MTDVQMALERGESVKIIDNEHGLFVHVWLDDKGLLHTSISNGEKDSIQIESRETIISLKSPRGEPLKDLIQ